MSDTAKRMIREVLGEDRVKSMTAQEHQKLINDLTRTIQERGQHEARRQIRQIRNAPAEQRPQARPQQSERVDLHRVGAGILAAATVHTVLTAGQQEAAREAQLRAEQERAEQESDRAALDDDGPLADPYAMRDPRPHWA